MTKRKPSTVPCATDGCDRLVYCRGMCTKHYLQWWNENRVNTRVCIVDGCDKPFQAKDLCKRHYAQLLTRGHTLPMRAKPTVEERFWAKVQKDAEHPHGDSALSERYGMCWIWTGCRTAYGYGRFRVCKGQGGVVSAHIWTWEQLNGPKPSDMDLDHFVCDRTSCVNPEHTRPVAHIENVLRGNGVTSANAAKTHCIRGHELPDEYTVESNGQVRRRCVPCQRINQQAATARRSERRRQLKQL